MSPKSTDVLIVGAGPTGLLLAGDLAAAGVSVTVLERRTDESNLTRAFAVHARTLELLDARGVADELIATGTTVGKVALFGRAAVDLTALPSRYPFLLVTPQYNTERVLQERAVALGAKLVRGAEVTGLHQDNHGVDVEVRTGGAVTSWRAGYVVGTDGVRSAVRTALGLEFPGETAVASVMLADVRLTERPAEVLTVGASPDGFAFIAPFGDGWYRVIAWDRRNQQPDSAPVELAEIAEITRLALGTDYGLHDVRWMSRFHSDERQAPSYRVGRVFLAGDAAHVHSPAGGQGMNTGIQDAANLSWKLAAAVHGWAPEGLLDSYQAERHPVGRDVLRNSGNLLRLALGETAVVRAARGLVAGVLTRLGPVAQRARETVSGIGVHYPAPRGSHRLAGTRAADRPLADGGRLYPALRDGRFVLLTPSGADAAGEWGDRVLVTAPADGAGPTTLVRPDGYVAWATDETDPARRAAAVRAALTEWCGQASDTARA
jgi:2-polyprenyl-6-methoxyphenol hydroxylase-like FAD-dependent oxidoreductase